MTGRSVGETEVSEQRGIDQSTTNQRTVGTMFAVFICIYMHISCIYIYMYVIYLYLYTLYTVCKVTLGLVGGIPA